MAISEDTKAIVSQLEKNAELMRSSNEDSNREVHVRLDKFADAFVSISSNIRANNQMLQTSEKAADERLERDRADRDFADLKRDKDVKANKADTAGALSALKDIGSGIKESMSMSGLIKGIGSVIKAGLGVFVGYNFMKGFLGPKYDNMFESIESVLTSFSMADIPKAITDMTDSVTKAAKSIQDNVDTALKVIGGAVAAITALKMYFFGKKLGNMLGRSGVTRDAAAERETKRKYKEAKAQEKADKKAAKEKADAEKLEQQKLEKEKTMRARPDAIDLPGNSNGPDLGKVSAPIVGLNKTPTRKYGVPRSPMGNAAGNSTTNNFLSNSARDQRVAGYKGANQNATDADIKQAIKNVKHRKIFFGLAKGLGAVGVAMSVYQLYELYKLYKSGVSNDDMKRMLVTLFGEAVGGFAGFAAGAAIGVFGGPWGILIGGLAGGLIGSLFGGALLGAIWDWANEVPLTEKQALEKIDAQLEGLQKNYETMQQNPSGDVFQGDYMTGAAKRITELTGRRNEIAAGIARKMIVQNNQNSMETAAYGRGGRAMYEVATNGTPQQKAVLLDALIETNRGNREFFKDIEEFLQTSMTTIVNAPNNSSTIMAPVGGAVTKNDVNVLNTNSGSYTPHSSFGLPYSLN
jgi:hypothetical protein